MSDVRHVDAGYKRAVDVARERGVKILMIDDIPLRQTIIRERIAYRKAPKNEMGVTELRPPERDPKANAELTSLYAEILNG